MPDNASPDAVMHLRAVTFGYEPGAAVVDDVSGALHVGRLCVLLGPNAAGKSTLLKLMLGQLTPWDGAIDFDGGTVGEMSERQRAARMSYVPQRGALSFAFTVRQVIEMGRFACGRDGDAVDEALEACDLSDDQHRVFAHLSGGQQQRALLARAIAQSTGRGRVMLLDEPTNSMDLRHIHGTMRRLRGLTERGLAVLVVLHDLNLAARYADEVWLMDRGRLVTAGGWAEVMRSEVLEPVYRVGLRPLTAADSDRPVFLIDPGDTL